MATKSINKREIQAKTALNFVYSFVVLTFVNYLVLFLANKFFPSAVVLGTASLTPAWATLLAAEKLAIIGVAVMAFVAYKEYKRNKDFSPKEWMTVYLVVDVAAIWLLARMADRLGFGISSFWVAIVLGAVLDWAQGIAMMAYGKITGQES